MDKIIIYKEGVSLRDIFSQHRLSYSRPYTLAFALSMVRLSDHLNSFRNALLIYFTDNLDKQDRLQIRRLSAQYPEVKICLCSNELFALDAWKLDLFDFREHPVSVNAVKATYEKYINQTNKAGSNFSFKSREGIIKIDYTQVTYLEAHGNYTIFHMVGDRQSIQTKQLQNFEYVCSDDLNFKRVHRSYIINFKTIRTVKNQQVSFYGCNKPMNTSKALSVKIKRIILGKN